MIKKMIFAVVAMTIALNANASGRNDSFYMASKKPKTDFTMAYAKEREECHQTGDIGMSKDGLILSCQSGSWKKAVEFDNAKLTANGYTKLPSGLIVAWGSGQTRGDGTDTHALPVVFPNACLNAVASQSGNFNAWADAGAGVTSCTKTNITLHNGYGGRTPIRFIAFGY